jgi:hypothetical protein
MTVARILFAVVATLWLCGCGVDTQRLSEEARARGEQARQRAEDIRERGERIRADGRRLRARGNDYRERLTEPVRDVLEDIRKSVPQATPQTRPPATRGRDAAEIDAYLTDVVRRVDSYWTRTLTSAGLAEPRVSYVWVPAGSAVRTRCQAARPAALPGVRAGVPEANWAPDRATHLACVGRPRPMGPRSPPSGTA